MKVLWFAVNPSLYDAHRNGEHNGGGWIASLEKIIRTSDNIRLGVAFEHPDPIFKKEIDGVCYYPIRVKPGLRRRIYRIGKRQDNYCGLPESHRGFQTGHHPCFRFGMGIRIG